MAIEVVGKADAQKYETLCTDDTCRAVLHFDRDDVGWVSNSVAGHTTKTVEGISCPLCRQILPLEGARILTT